MKKALLIVVSLVLVAALAVAATVAYFTDREEIVNVMTAGNVQIKLNEQQRDGNGGLEDFEQNKVLMPIVGSAQGEKDEYGMSVASNYVDKIVSVTNTGKSDAYVRVIVGIPKELEETNAGISASQNALHWNTGSKFMPEANGEVPADQYSWEFVEVAVIDGVEYNVYAFNYNAVLEPDATTTAAFVGFYLDSRVDFDGENYTLDGEVINYDLSRGVYIPVMAQAVQVAGFENDFAGAFEAAGLPANPWNETSFNVVANSEELADAIANGGVVYLAEGDYTLPAEIANVTLIGLGDVNVAVAAPTTANTASVTLGDNATIKGLNIADNGNGIGNGNAALITVDGVDVVIEDCSFDISGTNAIAVSLGGGSVNTTIKNCDFVGGYKHIGPAPGTTGGIVIDGCTFSGANSTYAIHLNATANDVVIKNSEVALFNTFFGFGSDNGALVFENCDFVVEAGKTNVVKLYRDAEFINCDFEEGYLFSDANKDIAVDFVGGSWGEGTIKAHFLADSFSYNVTATFDGETWYWNTATDTWTVQ